MNNNFKVSVFLIVLFYTNLLFPKSNCEKYTTEKKMVKCFKKEFEKQDKILNQVYKNLKQRIESPLVEEMKLSSRNWINRKEYFCSNPMYTNDSDAEKKNSSYYSCLSEFTKERISYLKKAFGRENVRSGISGDYSDGEGGIVKISGNNEEFNFSISVVRGVTSHLGEVHGKFKLLDNEIKWKENNTEETCELDFYFSNYTLLVKEIDCSGYHGAKAYFDGTYRKIK